MLVIAHRGSSQLAPENTLPAIEKALQDKAKAIEIDVQCTKDGKVVVIHDEWVNRTTNGAGFVCDLTFDDIQQLDAGHWFHSKFKGVKVPSLAQVLDIIKKTNVTLHLELKNNIIPYPQLEKVVIDEVKKFSLEEQVVLSSFRQDSLMVCRQLAPHIRRGLLCWDTLEPYMNEAYLKSLDLFSLHPHISLINANVAYIQAHGVKVYPYVIERKSQLSLCQQCQVDGLFTNTPRIVNELLKQNH